MEAGEQVYGVEVGNLQDGIVVADSAISGTLKKQESFEQFDPSAEDTSGYYLALDFRPVGSTTIKTKVTNGVKDEFVDATSDGYCVYKISNNQNQKIQVQADELGHQQVNKTYDLTGLTLQEYDG